MTTYLVNEYYSCLQGEGFNLGKPSILVRLQICNLRCTWCDTPYTHTYKSDPISEGSQEQKFKRVELEELVKTLRSFKERHIIFTGGEPTLQNLAPLMKCLGNSFSAEVESNGTQIPHLKHKDFSQEDYFLFQWNISFKGKNAGEAIVTEAVEHWGHLAKSHNKVFFKFVIRKDNMKEDLEEISQIIKMGQIKPERVYLMPEGTSQESQLNNVWLQDLCIEEGFHYTPRLHILLFGNKRGV